MSDFDRNFATARSGYRTDQVAIDAGLRAYMIRVYNYMAAVSPLPARRVADLSGCRWQQHSRPRQPDHRTYAVRPSHLQPR